VNFINLVLNLNQIIINWRADGHILPYNYLKGFIDHRGTTVSASLDQRFHSIFATYKMQ